MRQQDREKALELVGRAFRCSDGLTRWVTHLSERGYYQLLWLNEENSAWQSGGIMKPTAFNAIRLDEVTAPKAGERYRYIGALGGINERVAAHG